MCTESNQPGNTEIWVRRAGGGDPEALSGLRQKHHAAVRGILVARGANPTEAEDILADLWADCVRSNGDTPSLLEKFSGRCTFRGWLATVATHRWVDFRRRASRQVDLGEGKDGERGELLESRSLELGSVPHDDALTRLLAEALEVGFSRCPAEAMVCLRLVHLHAITQREVAQMLGWSDAKVSRYLAETMQGICRATLAEVRRRDPWLELTWEDFMELCGTQQIGSS